MIGIGRERLPAHISVGPPVGRLACSAAALVVSVLAGPLAHVTRESAADLSPVSVVGYFSAFVSILAFVWFRGGDLAVRADRDYVIPAWNPPRVARVVASLALAAALVHALVIAGALARW